MAEGSENGGFDGGNSGGKSGGEAGGFEGGKSGGEAGGFEGGKSGGEADGFEGGKSGGEAGGFEGGKSGGEAGGFEGGKSGGEAGGFEGGKTSGEAGGFEGGKSNVENESSHALEGDPGLSTDESEKEIAPNEDSTDKEVNKESIDEGNTDENSETFENPNHKNCPKENGKWVGEDGKEGERGESKWVPDRDYVPNKSNSNPDHLTWGEILDKYDIDGINYEDGEPQFDKLIKEEVTIDNFTDNRTDNFDQADQKLAEKLGIDADEVEAWREENKYTWHECRDMQTMQLVPSIVHNNVSHRGGVSEAKGV